MTAWLASWTRQSLGELVFPPSLSHLSPWPQLRSVPHRPFAQLMVGLGCMWLLGESEPVWLPIWATRQKNGRLP